MKRRHFVRGAALAGISGFVAPLVQSVLQTASAQPTNHLRFLFVTTTNAVFPWQNASLLGDHDEMHAGAGLDPREFAASIPSEHVDTQDLIVPPLFAPLAAHVPRMLYVDGLSQRCPVDANAHSKGPQLFNGLNNMAETIDQYLARGLNAPHRWVGMGATRRSGDTLHQLNSVDQSGARAPFISRPSVAFDTYIGTGDVSAPTSRPLQPSLFSAASDDIRRARTQLRGTEGEILEQYLDSVAALESSFAAQTAAAASCDTGGAIADPDNHAERWTQLYNIATTVLGCGLSRMVWLSFGGGVRPSGDSARRPLRSAAAASRPANPGRHSAPPRRGVRGRRACSRFPLLDLSRSPKCVVVDPKLRLLRFNVRLEALRVDRVAGGRLHAGDLFGPVGVERLHADLAEQLRGHRRQRHGQFLFASAAEAEREAIALAVAALGAGLAEHLDPAGFEVLLQKAGIPVAAAVLVEDDLARLAVADRLFVKPPSQADRDVRQRRPLRAMLGDQAVELGGVDQPRREPRAFDAARFARSLE